MISFKLTKDLFLGVIMGQVGFADATKKGLITVDSDAAFRPKYFRLNVRFQYKADIQVEYSERLLTSGSGRSVY